MGAGLQICEQQAESGSPNVKSNKYSLFSPVALDRGVYSADVPGLNSCSVGVLAGRSLPACRHPPRGPATSTMNMFTTAVDK